MTPWTRLCLRQADRVVVVVDVNENDASFADNVPSRLLDHHPDPLFHPRVDLVLLHTADRPARQATDKWLGLVRADSHHHVRLSVPADFARLARRLTRRAVGLVLSGGGAHGFVHIGVVKALREAGREIDLVGGSSMGALIGAAVASQWTDAEIRDRFHRSFVASNPLCDYKIPFVSLFAGRHITRLLQEHFGDTRIEDLPLDFFCMTTNLTTRKSATLRCGSLWEGLLASVSIPGVLPPKVIADEAHVDGGVLVNFPVKEMKSSSVGLVIGSSIDISDRANGGSDILEPWTAGTFFRRLIWRRSKTLPLPPIIRILLRSALLASEINEHEERKAADILILPKMPGFDFLDWTIFERAVEIGYRTTVDALARDENAPPSKTLVVV